MVFGSTILSLETADPASAAQYSSQEDRPANFAPSGPPPADFNAAAAAAAAAAAVSTPATARSSNFSPDYLARQQQPFAPGHPASMAQATSPSLPLSDGNQPSQSPTKSNPDVPIDPSIAAASPTYSTGAPYSPYTPQGHDMAHYQGHPPQNYAGWAYPGPHGLPYHSPGASSAGGSPATTGPPRPGQVSPGARSPVESPLTRKFQVYSFVPIPGAQQHKRPRRRYEEIERMYKCGFQGCEKAYGTLNHLNAHVTMQSHGSKRTPEGEHCFFAAPLQVSNRCRTVERFCFRSRVNFGRRDPAQRF